MKYLIILVLLTGCTRDDSDPRDGISGFEVFTDNLTGCQYIGWGWKAITPRLGADGKQICRARP